MKTIIKTTILGAAVAISASATAQNTTAGYFLDGNLYGYQLNPAFGNDKAFFSMPALGNMSAGINGDLDVRDVIYNVNGRTTTFMNPGVSVEEVMSNIKETNRTGVDIAVPVLAVGFKGFGGYNTVTLGTRVMADVKIPGAIFSFLKEGVANKTYDIGDIHTRATSYATLALGHSHQISKKIRVGANVKLLVGAGYAEADIERAQLALGENSWQVTTEGAINASVKGLQYKTKVNENTGHRYVNDVDVDGGGVGGFGAAIDLGVVVTPISDLTISASVLDLGFIKWDNNMLASTNGERTFNSSQYTFNVDDNAPNSFDNEWEQIKDALSGLYELDDCGDTGSVTRSLGTTTNIGVEYKLPVYRKLSFGLLNTSRFQGDYSWTDFRLSANWEASKIFDASVSATTGTFGTGMGWMANLHVTGFNLFVGMDRIFSKMSKDGVPLASNASFNFGINFPL